MLDKRTRKVVIEYLQSLYLNTFAISGLYYIAMFGVYGQDRDLYLTAFFYGTLFLTWMLVELVNFARNSFRYGFRKNIKRIKKTKIREEKKQLVEDQEGNFYLRHRVYLLIMMILTYLEGVLIKIYNKFPTYITNLLAHRISKFMIHKRIEYFVAQPISPNEPYFKLSAEVEDKLAIINIDKPIDMNLKPFRRAVVGRFAYYMRIPKRDVMVSKIDSGVRVIMPLNR